MRIIKKYAVRKMYDVKESRFITLAGVANMIVGGEEVQVIDNKTGNDITDTVLAQVILEQQKSRQNLSSVPGLLREFIKKGAGSVVDFLDKPIFGPLGLVSLTEEKARQIIGRLVKMGKVSIDEGDNLLKGLLAKTGESKKIMESFIKKTVIRMNIPTRVEFKKLNAEIDRLKDQLATIRTSNKAGTT